MTTTSTVDHDLLVDAAWLAAHLSDPLLRVVEVDVSLAAYEDWHIEGADVWNIYADLKTPDFRPADELEVAALLARTGITPDSTVVFYGYGPAFGLWLLQSHGHIDARILDCSRETWRASGYPTAVGAPKERTATPASGPIGEDGQLRAGQAQVRSAITDPSVVLLDVRSRAEYAGECFWPSGGNEPGARAGHVPSAVHNPLDGGTGGLYDERGAFRPRAELREVFTDVDVDGAVELITYCTIGARAATAWFVLSHLLGRPDVRVYDGSWAEWGHLDDTPVQTLRPTTREEAVMSPQEREGRDGSAGEATGALDLPGGRLHYLVGGSGEPVVLVHGLALDLRMWDDQMLAMAAIGTVVRYDVRGFGRSAADETTEYTHAGDLWQLVDHLGLDRVALVGLSMGGRIALEATMAAPKRVTSLVLLDAVVDGVPWDPDSAHGMELIGEELRRDGLAAAKAAWLRHPFFTPAQRQPRVAARLQEMVADYSGQIWTGHDPHGPHPRMQPLLAGLTVPTTVVVGELDVPCFQTMADVLAERIPDARKVVVPDAGHMVNMEAPERVDQILREALLAT